MRIWPYLLVAISVAACTPDYPMDRPGTWSLGDGPGTNDANLRAMVTDPHDLIAGAGETTSLGHESASPVKRLLTGHRTPLPQVDSLQVDNVGAPSPTPGGNNNVGQ